MLFTRYLFGLVLLLSVGAYAESTDKKRDFGLYVGAGIGGISVDAEDAFSKDVRFTGGEVFGGVYWRWIGIETRKGKGLEDENIKIGETPVTGVPILAKTSIENYTSLYLRLQLENDIARIYALLGSSRINTLSVFDDGEIVEASTSGNSYGIGAGVYINPRMNLNLEAKYLLNSEADTFLMTGFNIDFRF